MGGAMEIYLLVHLADDAQRRRSKKRGEEKRGEGNSEHAHMCVCVQCFLADDHHGERRLLEEEEES